MNQWLERSYGYVALGVVGIIGLVMANWFIWPQYQRMRSAGILQYRDITQVLDQRKRYIADLEVMQREYEALDQRVIRAIDVALPVDYVQGQVYIEVEQLLQGTPFTVDSVNVAVNSTTDPTETASPTVQTHDVYEVVTLSVNISAATDTVSYDDFKTLLARIERHPHLLNLEALTYSPGNTAFTFVLKTYQRAGAL